MIKFFMQIKCECCGKEIPSYDDALFADQGVFCSVDCMDKQANRDKQWLDLARKVISEDSNMLQ